MNRELENGAVIIGASAGGIDGLNVILPKLPRDFPLPVIVVIHLMEMKDDTITRMFNGRCELEVKFAEQNEIPVRGKIYFAPPAYHLEILKGRFNLRDGERVNFVKPSIDVLMKSAAENTGGRLAAVILSGANNDGAEGAAAIKKKQGIVITESSKTAAVSVMPEAVSERVEPDYNLRKEDIAAKILYLLSG